MPASCNAAVQKLLQDIITKHGAIIFNGDNYTAAWHEEAEKRGLPNLKTCVDALPVLAKPEVVAAVREVRRALAARDCRAATTSTSSSTCKTVNIEAKLVVEIAQTMILPAAVRYQSELATTCTNLKALGYTFDTDTLDEITRAGEGPAGQHRRRWRSRWPTTAAACSPRPSTSATTCCPAMAKVREFADKLEGFVADDLWPLPTYQEMLFIK